MSETLLFSIGAIVFAITVWGAVMAGGIWLTQLQEEQGDPTGAPATGNDQQDTSEP